jgi:hypothetical protein
MCDWGRPAVPRRRPTRRRTWPHLQKSWLDLLGDYVRWAESLDAGGWKETRTYRMASGAEFTTPLWQMVLHLVNHASYHRGQVVTLIRQAGGVPVVTDLIYYYRSLGEPS